MAGRMIPSPKAAESCRMGHLPLPARPASSPQSETLVSGPGGGCNGGQALRLPVNPVERTKITRAVLWEANEKTAFIDFRMKPAADPTGS